MKRLLIILIPLLFASTSDAVEPVVSMLATNVAHCRDEIFDFRVTFSDVNLDKKEFRFTETMLHKEEEGSMKVVMKYKLPLTILKASKSEVKGSLIGRNTFVRIKLPQNTPSTAIASTIETIDSEGKKTVEKKSFKEYSETDGNETFFAVDVYFPDKGAATKWNEEFSKMLAQ